MVKLTICCGRKSQLVVSCQVVTNSCCGLAVTCSGFIWLLIGRKTINITEIFSSVHGFTGKIVATITNCMTFSCLASDYMNIHIFELRRMI